MTQFRGSLRFALPIVLAIGGYFLQRVLVPQELVTVLALLDAFPDANVQAEMARPTVLLLLCYLPALAGLVYCLGNTLDRYMVRRFVSVFAICVLALATVWLLLDLSDNLSDFRKGDELWAPMLRFYLIRSPTVILLLLPYALLLAVLYALGRFSKDREIIGMIQSGRGLVRLCMPLILIGVFCTLFCAGLNFQWAPAAESQRSEMLDEAIGLDLVEAREVLFHNPVKRRVWLIGAFPLDYARGAPLENLSITTLRADGTLLNRLTARTGSWNRNAGTWTFDGAVIARFRSDEPPQYEIADEPLVRKTWTETPAQLIKPGLSAAHLGVPALITWLEGHHGKNLSADPAPYLTNLHYRLALPFTCLVSVLLAAPMAIHFSRRGSGGSVFLAVVLSALMLLLSSVTLSAGEAALIHPGIAAWAPNLLFLLLGLYLFHRRRVGRPIYQSLLRLLPNTGRTPG